MKRLIVSHIYKADAEQAYEMCKAGQFGDLKIIRVLSKPKRVYTRWEFDIEVEG